MSTSGLKDSELKRALALLKLTPADLFSLRRGKSHFEALKAAAKQNYRKAVFELHPDRHGDDPQKTADLQLLNRFMDELDRMVPPAIPVYGARRRSGFKINITVRMPQSE